MQFEVLKRSHVKRNILIGALVVAVISAVILNFTRAKYRTTQSIPLVNGTINYTPYDFKVMAIYQENDNGEYEAVNVMPSNGYTINEELSYCTIDNVNNDTNAKLYTNADGEHVIANLQKGSKCYLYFDKNIIGNTMLEIIKKYDIDTGTPNFSNTSCAGVCDESTNGVYSAKDWTGNKSYCFRGTITNNWVRFGEFYWRIIRINGNGSVRMIYNGPSTETTGIETMINNETEYIFNNNYNRSEYVGLKYSIGQQHGQTSNSSVLNTLQTWYSTSNLNVYDRYVDNDIGFCSDRNVSNGYTWNSMPSSRIDYAALGRLMNYIGSAGPTLLCEENDIIKVTLGLITADELVFAGNVYGSMNTGFYLYNQQDYWTMTPFWFNPAPYPTSVFSMKSTGYFDGWQVNNSSGVRPVINIKADTLFSGSGTTSDPYTIVEA